MLEKIIDIINSIIWSPVLVVVLIAAGIFLSYKTRFIQITRIGLMVKSLFGSRNNATSKGITSFQAFCIALSGRVGTGNIVGVASAIGFGGPGAVFWMWLIAFFGAATAYTESTLAQIYKFKHNGVFRGGPFAYIHIGLGHKKIGITFAIATIIGYGTLLPAVQANGVSSAMQTAFNIPPIYAGLVLATLVGLVVIGGIKRISKVASIVTPFMALGYITLAMIVIFFHINDIPNIITTIFKEAFGVGALGGGIIGSTIMMGVKRGIFSNEAGQGGGAIVSASADVPHPAQQGLAQAFSVYIDTLLVCTVTALMILSSGCYNIIDSQTNTIIVTNALELGTNYPQYTQAAVNTVFNHTGAQFVGIALVFFVFTTIMAYYFYSESALTYIFHHSGTPDNPRKEKICIRFGQIVLLSAVVFGSTNGADLTWKIGDIGVGLTTWINVVALFLLYPKAIKALNDYLNNK